MVEKWGEPDSSKCVLAASSNDRKNDPVCVGCYKLFEFIEYWILSICDLLGNMCHFFFFLVLVPIVSLVWFCWSLEILRMMICFVVIWVKCRIRCKGFLVEVNVVFVSICILAVCFDFNWVSFVVEGFSLNGLLCS